MSSANVDDLVEKGVLCYKSKEYLEAIKVLTAAVDQDKNHWRGRLYLGMSLVRAYQPGIARQQFTTIVDFCPDEKIKSRAETALTAMQNAQDLPRMTQEYQKFIPPMPPPYKHED